MATDATTIHHRTTSLKRQFATNAASGFVAQAVTVGVGGVLMPYLMWRLGPEVYGISRLAQSALMFFALLQLGMGPTLVRYCSQAIARHDQEAIRKVSSTAQLILGTLGLLGMFGIVAFIPLFLKFYDVPAEMTFSVSGLLLCLAVSLWLLGVIGEPGVHERDVGAFGECVVTIETTGNLKVAICNGKIDTILP